MRRLLLSFVVGLAVAATAAGAGTIPTANGSINIENVATGLDSPWGMAFLPDGRLLVTEKPGRLRIITSKGAVSAPITGVPATVDDGQGGFLDVAVHRDFRNNGLIFMSFAEPGPGGAGVAVLRARLVGTALVDARVIWRVSPKTGSGPQGVEGANHYGSRLAFTSVNYLLVTLGDRFLFDPAQDPGTAIGKIVRITTDGAPAPSNPFVGRAGYRAEIFTTGHRNPQGIVVHPWTGDIWSTEHGPRGGDELNIIGAGSNYGWPLVSWGDDYNGPDYPNHDTRSDFAAPIRWWTPSIAPSNIAFYRGTIPGWKGNMLIGSLGENALIRLSIKGRTVTGEERIPIGERVRDVEVDAKGRVYLLTDDGNLKRLSRP